MNYPLARTNMVDQHIRPWQVTDEAVLRLFSTLSRENFVPEKYHALAYADTAIPLSATQAMLPPKTLARGLQALQIQPSDKVLEIGGSNGYTTLLLASLARQLITTYDDIKQLKRAKHQIAKLSFKNITFLDTDGTVGVPQHAPYHKIFVNGAYPTHLPSVLGQQLSIGGRLFGFIGQSPVMKALLIERQSADEFKMDVLFETVVPFLPHVRASSPFVF